MILWRSYASIRSVVHKPTLRVSPSTQIRWRSTTPAPALTRRVQGLFSSLRRRISDGQPLEAANYFYKYMKDTKLRPETRFEAYARSIRLFMVQGHISQAYGLYSRMQDEGYIPPPKIQASLFFLQKLTAGESTKELLDAAREAFGQEGFDEREFRHVLRMASAVSRLPSSLYEDLIRIFIESRGEESYTLSPRTEALLAYARTRRGWRGEMAVQKLSLKAATLAHRATKRSPDIDALLDMAAADEEVAPIIHSAVRRMRHTDGTHDRIFYNAIITAFADRRRYVEVFSLYNMMLSGDASILPDAYTFGTLFRVIDRLSGARSHRNRKDKVPENLPTLRVLYRDMVYCHRMYRPGKLTADSPVLKGTLFNRILRYFIDAGDFAAAYVALKSFDVFNIPVTVATYHAVIGGIILRVQRERWYLADWSTDREQYWTYRFLGSPQTIPKEINARVMDGILGFGSKASLAVNLEPIKLYPEEHLREIAKAVEDYNSGEDERDIPEVTFRDFENEPEQQSPAKTPSPITKPYRRIVRHEKTHHRSYRVPTAVCILGLVTPPVDLWDTQPLVRIIKRAILASRPRVFLPASNVISMEIRQARSEMMPVLKPPTKEIQRPVMASA